MALNKLRIGMVGAGWVTGYHLPAWRSEASRAAVVAICDPDIEAARRRADAFEIPYVFASAEAMLEQVPLDALDICAPRESHPRLVRAGADRRLAVLCQKPLAPSLAEAEALVAEIGSRIPLMIHENWRFRPYYRRLREWIAAGLLGELRQVQFEFISSGMIPDADGNRPALVRQPFFRTLQRLLVMEVLIHHLDTLRFLVGDMSVTVAHLGRSNDDIIGEDMAAIALRRDADRMPVFVVGNLATHGAPPAPVDRLRLIGSRGVATLDANILRLVGETVLEEAFDGDASYAGSYAAAIAHFLDGLAAGGKFETAPADNLRTLALVEDAYRLSGYEDGG
jgi:D-apiose dehydrogenase